MATSPTIRSRWRRISEVSWGEVAAGGYDLGIVVDPDVDRLAFIQEDGKMYGEEYTLVSVADYILDHVKGATVSNLSSTRACATSPSAMAASILPLPSARSMSPPR